MIKRVIEVSAQPAHLSSKSRQLVITKKGSDDCASIPCEDIGLLIVDNACTTYSHSALSVLLDHGAAIVVCGKNHLPNGLLLPFTKHSRLGHVLKNQVEISLPTKKRLWKQIVQAKIKAQAQNLEPDSSARKELSLLVSSVKSGDITNVEARAAIVYWRALFSGADFKRDQKEEQGPNAMLNYGYAILRAAVARALISAGFQPALGLQHRNRSNPFCLADDIMEPLRPLVDTKVVALLNDEASEINRVSKEALLSLLTETVTIDKENGPLMVSLHRMCASLARCYAGEENRLSIPLAAD